MPTPQAYQELLEEYQELKRAAFKYLNAHYDPARRAAREELWELAGDYEPTEEEQGLIPIPAAYAEQ